MFAYYIVPSIEVASFIKSSHKKWLKTLGKNNKKHNDNNIRHYILNEEYRDAWCLLK